MIRSRRFNFNMRIVSIIIIFGFLFSGCDVSSDLTIDYVGAYATFKIQDGITEIAIWVRLKNDNSHMGNIKHWSFTIKEGSEVLLVLNKDNYKDILGDGLHHFTDFDISDEGSVYLDNWSQYYCQPYFGDLFNGRNPNQIDVAIDIKNGNDYRLTGTYSFAMKRE